MTISNGLVVTFLYLPSTVKYVTFTHDYVQVIKNVQRAVKFFRKSSHAASTLKERRKVLGIARGIQSVGKTRFGTIYAAANSIQKNFPAILELCQQKRITIPDINNLFLSGLEATDFLQDLNYLTSVLSPITKSIQ